MNTEIDEIQKEIDCLNLQYSALYDKIELLNNKKEGILNKNALELIMGTSWAICNNSSSLLFIGDNKSEFKIYVCDVMKLYPHGKTYLTEKITIQCDDGSIRLGYDMSMPEFELSEDNDVYEITKVIEFCKQYDMTIDLEYFAKDIEFYKIQYDYKMANLNIYKQLIEGK